MVIDHEFAKTDRDDFSNLENIEVRFEHYKRTVESN
jgi:hypothetical protein